MYRYGAVLALAALVAVGCSDEHAGSLPTLSPTPTTTSLSPTPTPTASLADEASRAVRTYFATLASAGQAGDTTALERLVAAGCTCRDQVSYIKREAAAGHRITTTYVLESVRAHDLTAAGGSVTVTFSSPASKVVDAKGATVRTLGALRHVGMEISLRRDPDSSWVVVRIVRLGA
jgi:hypothetical protein